MNNVPMRILLVVTVLFCSNFSFAAPEPPPPTPPPGFPVDSGIVVMLMVALILGAYKIHQYKKRAVK